MCALPAPRLTPLTKKALKIKNDIDSLIMKMQKNPNFSPTRAQLEDSAEDLLEYIRKNHSETAAHQTYLKAAIIDLTEVPEMAPQMQRISFMTALKDASHELELFLSCF